MTSGEFEKLTERYKAGKCTPEEIAFIEKWVELNYGTNDNDKAVFESEAEAIGIENDLWSTISEAAGISRKPTGQQSARWLLGGVAASVTLLFMAYLLLNRIPGNTPEITMTGIETHNTSINRQRIILPDSSVVTLGEGARIITSENYGEHTRTVHLTGEAFFDIKRNPKKPFLVYTGDLVTEVLGTSFHVKPELTKKTIEVSVVTGKVSVYVSEKDRKQRQSGVIINPNQKVVYNTNLKTIRQDIVDHPEIVTREAPDLSFKFDETPVGDALAKLRRAYGMDIVVNNSELNNCIFTGNLNGFDLFKQLNYICDAIDAEYEVRGTSIFLTGNGCAVPVAK